MRCWIKLEAKRLWYDFVTRERAWRKRLWQRVGSSPNMRGRPTICGPGGTIPELLRDLPLPYYTYTIPESTIPENLPYAYMRIENTNTLKRRTILGWHTRIPTCSPFRALYQHNTKGQWPDQWRKHDKQLQEYLWVKNNCPQFTRNNLKSTMYSTKSRIHQKCKNSERTSVPTSKEVLYVTNEQKTF